MSVRCAGINIYLCQCILRIFSLSVCCLRFILMRNENLLVGVSRLSQFLHRVGRYAVLTSFEWCT